MVKSFLKEDDIPALTSFSGNIDADSLLPHIRTAQTNDIKRILGTDLYNKIYEDYVAGTLDGVYKEIYDDYVVSMLVYFACTYYMAFGGYKTSNNGIHKATFDGAQVVDYKEVEILIGRYRQLANNMEQNFYNYIKTVSVVEYNRTSNDEYNNNPIIPWY